MPRVAVAAVKRIGKGQPRSDQDLVAVEAPLTITLHRSGTTDRRSLGVLMRTPGDDDDLVRGLLYTERIIRSPADLIAIEPSDDAVDVTLASDLDLAAVTADRASIATSACGLCGRLSIDRLESLGDRVPSPHEPRVAAPVIAGLPAALRKGQKVFDETGGLHAAGLFDVDGRLRLIREDVGRHCAVDKVVGAALDAGWLPARHDLLAVSGRVAFEIVQKAAVAGVPIVVAVGAPSSLAVEAARAGGVTLVGFTRRGRFNVYTGVDRVAN